MCSVGSTRRATITDNLMCDSSVPSHMPAVAGTHYRCHMWDYNTCATADAHKWTLMMAISCLEDAVAAINVISIKQKPWLSLEVCFLGILCAPSSPYYLTSIWLKTPADSGDRVLPRRHLESRGRRWSSFRSQYKSPTPKTLAILGHWPTNKRLSQIHFPHACQHCVCFNSLEGHFPSISIRLRVLIERRPAQSHPSSAQNT